MMTHPLLRLDVRTRFASRFDAFVLSFVHLALLAGSLIAAGLLLMTSATTARADLRDYTVRWLPSPSQGVDGYELAVGTSSGDTSTVFDLGHPSVDNGELRYAMQLEDSIDLHLRLRAYGGGAASAYSNEVVVAAAKTPGTYDFGVLEIQGVSGVVSGQIVVVAEVFGATESVHFLIDGASYRIENGAPYSLQSDSGGPGTEYPFDTTILSDGEHTITAVGFSQNSASGVEGASVTLTFYVDNAVDPLPEPGPSPTPDPDPAPTPDPTPVPPVGPEGAIAGLFATDTGDIVALHVNGMTTVLANHELARGGDLRPAWCHLDGDADLDLVLGFGPGSEARLLLLRLEDLQVIDMQVITGAPAKLRGVTGETFPACGDIDGDALDEIAVGLGAGSLASIRLMDDYARGYKPMKADFRSLLRTMPSVTAFDIDYMRDGSVQPVLADIDGDGRDEIVVGRSEGGRGTVSIFDDTFTGYELLDSLKDTLGILDAVPDVDYQQSSGATRVTAGDLDGDGLAEIVVGTGVGGGSRLYVYDDARHGFAPIASSANGLEFGFAGYNDATGLLQPTLADVDGDGLPEISLGFGEGGEGVIQLLDDVTTGFAPLVWTGDAEGLVQAPAGTGSVASGIQPGL